MMSRLELLSDCSTVAGYVACRRCDRSGRNRLARLPVRYGSKLPLNHPLSELSRDRALWATNPQIKDRCGAYSVGSQGRTSPDPRIKGVPAPLSDWPVIRTSVICATCGLHQTFRRCDLPANSTLASRGMGVPASLIRNCRDQRAHYLRAKRHARLIGH